MNDRELLLKAFKEYKEKLLNDREACFKFLLEVGVINESTIRKIKLKELNEKSDEKG